MVNGTVGEIRKAEKEAKRQGVISWLKENNRRVISEDEEYRLGKKFTKKVVADVVKSMGINVNRPAVEKGWLESEKK